MQLSNIAFAVAAVCAATAATAAPLPENIAKSAGASAVQNNVRLAVESLCVAPNVATSFVSGNFTTVVCADVALATPSPTSGTSAAYAAKPDSEFRFFANLPFKEIRFNVSAGSFGSVQILNPTVAGNPTFLFRNPGSGVNTDPTDGGKIIGGISDVETNRFPETTIGANKLSLNTKLGAAQVFGVGASLPLYDKMFAAQQAAGLIPAICTSGMTSIPYCIPNIAKAQMASIMSSNDTNAAYVKGVGFLTGVAADDGTELRYVRRVDTSGTQASAQNYFLGLPCSANSLAVVTAPTTIDPAGGTIANLKIENIRVYAAGGTSNVLTELNKPGVFALGVASGENRPTAVQNWRWLRVDGAPIGENAIPHTATNTNTNTMRDGQYSFYYEATYTGGDVNGVVNGVNVNDMYWATIAAAFGGLSAPVGLVNQTDLDAGYNKGGLTCLGSSSN